MRTGLTVAAVLLIAAGTQVVPEVPVPPVEGLSTAVGVPRVSFESRIQTNREQVAAAATEAEPDRAEVYRSIYDEGRQLLHFDPDENRGRGSWIELVGSIDRHTQTVGILVPGSGAVVLDENFDRYYQRAADLVAQSDGTAAVVVWAAGRFPKGWVQGAFARFHIPLGRALARFSHELRAELVGTHGPAAPQVRVVAMGHSFGGAVVGAAERHGLAADSVVHIASAGMGMVRDPYDYPDPHRPRYAMTAPGDLIGLVQGIPTPPGLGHGPAPARFRCVAELPTGRLPADAAARDEEGLSLGERAGAVIRGVSSHSTVFIRHSDAWWQLYRVLTGGAAPPVPSCPPPAPAEEVPARFLPQVVPRVVTVGQCRTAATPSPRSRANARNRRSNHEHSP